MDGAAALRGCIFMAMVITLSVKGATENIVGPAKYFCGEARLPGCPPGARMTRGSAGRPVAYVG